MICWRLSGWVKARVKGAAWEMGYRESYDIGFVVLERGGYGGKKGVGWALQAASIFEIKS